MHYDSVCGGQKLLLCTFNYVQTLSIQTYNIHNEQQKQITGTNYIINEISTD